MPRRKKKSLSLQEASAEKKDESLSDDEVFLSGVAKDTCTIKTSPEMGRYVLTKKRLKEGDVILIDEPLVVGPCQNTETVCIGCCSLLKTDIKFCHRCGGCGWPICGGGCPGISGSRDITRGGHSNQECQLLKNYTDSLVPSCFDMITPLRCLLLRQNDPRSWTKLVRMESHDEIRRRIPSIWTKNQMTVVEPIRKLAPQFTEELIHTVCGVLEVNCFSVGGDGVEARGLYSMAYLFQHDCTPNTGHMDSNTFTMTVRATVDIAQAMPITLSYTSTLSGTHRRRRELKESKFFDCCCSRCCSNTELGTYISAVKCTHCSKGWLLPDQPLKLNSPWLCCSCQQSVHYSIPVNVTERSALDFENLKNATISDYEKLLSKYEMVLHPNHSTLIRIKYALNHMYGKTEGCLLANMSLELLQRKYTMCRDLLKVFDVIEPGLSRIRGVTLYECHAPLMMITQRAAATGGMTQKEVKRDFRRVREMLVKSVIILSYEPKDTAEGQIYEAAKDALAQAEQWPI